MPVFAQQCHGLVLALLAVGELYNTAEALQIVESDVSNESAVVQVLPAPLNPSKDRLLLYTYGKVGSSALQVAMGDYMGTGFIPFVNDKLYEYGKAIDTHSPFVAENFLAKVPNGTRVFLFAATRNPFLHEVSNFFEQVMGIMQGASNVMNADMTRLSKEFHEHFKRSIQMHNEWFMVTLARVAGVDMKAMAKDFDFNAHRLVFEHQYEGNKTLVMCVLRFEEIGEWNTILAPLFPGFNMVKARSASSRWGHKYQEFLDNYEWTNDQVQQKLKSDSLPFYTESEKQAMLAHVRKVPM